MLYLTSQCVSAVAIGSPSVGLSVSELSGWPVCQAHASVKQSMRQLVSRAEFRLRSLLKLLRLTAWVLQCISSHGIQPKSLLSGEKVAALAGATRWHIWIKFNSCQINPHRHIQGLFKYLGMWATYTASCWKWLGLACCLPQFTWLPGASSADDVGQQQCEAAVVV